MTSRPHDALFKAAFEQPVHAAGLLRSILPDSLREAIRWDTLTHEPGSFIDPNLDDTHSDLLFSARLGTHEAYLYLLFEHLSPVASRRLSRCRHGSIRHTTRSRASRRTCRIFDCWSKTSRT